MGVPRPFAEQALRRTEAARGNRGCSSDAAKCIVLDEPTAMLDPSGRREVIRTVQELNRKEHVTVILITHYMEEVIEADRIIVMDQAGS